MSRPIPVPPFEMRQLVGPTDEAAFDNPTRDLLFDVPAPYFDSVLDFGCGCGRLARHMMQQRQPPGRYKGFDLHPGMIRWCQQNLTPHARHFQFAHHDVANRQFNPAGGPAVLPMPAEDRSASLIIALSVFTHTVQDHAEYYLREVERVMRPDGMMVASFFLFEKRYFPMMQDFQNALYVNADDPWNAVIFDRQWLEARLAALGLGVVRVTPPGIRGYHWLLYIRRIAAGEPVVPLPEDRAPFDRLPPPVPTSDPSKVGL